MVWGGCESFESQLFGIWIMADELEGCADTLVSTMRGGWGEDIAALTWVTATSSCKQRP